MFGDFRFEPGDLEGAGQERRHSLFVACVLQPLHGDRVLTHCHVEHVGMVADEQPPVKAVPDVGVEADNDLGNACLTANAACGLAQV